MSDRPLFLLPGDDPEQGAACLLALIAYPELGDKGVAARRNSAFYLRAWHHQQRKAADPAWRLSEQVVIPTFLLSPYSKVNQTLDRIDKRLDAAWIVRKRIDTLAVALISGNAPAEDKLRPILRRLAIARARKKHQGRNNIGDISDRTDKISTHTWKASLQVLHLALALASLLTKQTILSFLDGGWTASLIDESEARARELSVSWPNIESALADGGNARDLRQLRSFPFVKAAIEGAPLLHDSANR